MPYAYYGGAWHDDTGAVVADDDLTSLRNGQIQDWQMDLRQLAIQHLGFTSGYEYKNGNPRQPTDKKINAFNKAFQRKIRDVMLSSYTQARGGHQMVSEAEWEALAGRVNDQLDFADGFKQAMQDGKLTPAQMVARAALYAGAAVKEFERGKTMQRHLDLPAMPGDHCAGHNNCRCSWTIKELDDQWHCTWNSVDDGGTCGWCSANGARWAPLIVLKNPKADYSVDLMALHPDLTVAKLKFMQQFEATGELPELMTLADIAPAFAAFGVHTFKIDVNPDLTSEDQLLRMAQWGLNAYKLAYGTQTQLPTQVNISKHSAGLYQNLRQVLEINPKSFYGEFEWPLDDFDKTRQLWLEAIGGGAWQLAQTDIDAKFPGSFLTSADTDVAKKVGADTPEAFLRKVFAELAKNETPLDPDVLALYDAYRGPGKASMPEMDIPEPPVLQPKKKMLTDPPPAGADEATVVAYLKKLGVEADLTHVDTWAAAQYIGGGDPARPTFITPTPEQIADRKQWFLDMFAKGAHTAALQGIPFPEKVIAKYEAGAGNPGYAAFWSPHGTGNPGPDFIELSLNSDAWNIRWQTPKDPITPPGPYNSLEWSAGPAIPEYTWLHELGHSGHLSGMTEAERTPYHDWSDVSIPFHLQQVAKGKVSSYAQKNPAEWVAEVYAGTEAGTVFAPEVYELYKALKGPWTQKIANRSKGVLDDDIQQSEPYVPGKIKPPPPTFQDSASITNFFSSMDVDYQGIDSDVEPVYADHLIRAMYKTDLQGHPTPKKVRVIAGEDSPGSGIVEYDKDTETLNIYPDLMRKRQVSTDDTVKYTYTQLGRAAWHLGEGEAAAGGDFATPDDKKLVKDKYLFSGDPGSFVGTVFAWQMMGTGFANDETKTALLRVYEEMNGPTVNPKLLKVSAAAPPLSYVDLPDPPKAPTVKEAEAYLKSIGVKTLDIAAGVKTFNTQYAEHIRDLTSLGQQKKLKALPDVDEAEKIFLGHVLHGIHSSATDGINVPEIVEIHEHPPEEPTSNSIADMTRSMNRLRVFTGNPTFWVDPNVHQAMADSGWHSDGSIPGIIVHEMGHAGSNQNFAAAGTQYREWTDPGIPRPPYEMDYQKMKSSVSQYGATSPPEWIAEFYAGVRAGKSYKPDQYDFYEQLGGPVTPAVQAARKGAEHFAQEKAKAEGATPSSTGGKMTPEEAAAWIKRHAPKEIAATKPPLPDPPKGADLTPASASKWMRTIGVEKPDLSGLKKLLESDTFKDAPDTLKKQVETFFLETTMDGFRRTVELGMPLPKKLIIDAEDQSTPFGEGALAEYDNVKDAIIIYAKNSGYAELMTDPAAYGKKQGSWWATPSDTVIPANYVMLHEMGHKAHMESMLASGLVKGSPEWGYFWDWSNAQQADSPYFTDTLPIEGPRGVEHMMHSVSDYAATNPMEFIAEMHTGAMLGRKYDDDQIMMYKYLRGPWTPAMEGARSGLPTKPLNPDEQREEDARIQKRLDSGFSAGPGYAKLPNAPKANPDISAMKAPPLPAKTAHLDTFKWMMHAGVTNIDLAGMDDWEKELRKKGSSDPALEREALNRVILEGLATGLQASDQAESAPDEILVPTIKDNKKVGFVGKGQLALTTTPSVGAGRRTIAINTADNPDYWRDDREAAKMQAAGWLTTGTRQGAIIHEVGHMINYDRLKKEGFKEPGKKGADLMHTADWNTFHQILPREEADKFQAILATKPEIKRAVSEYGAGSPGEWVAEVYAGMVGAGKNYPADVMELYALMKGPEVSPTYVYTPAKGAS